MRPGDAERTLAFVKANPGTKFCLQSEFTTRTAGLRAISAKYGLPAKDQLQITVEKESIAIALERRVAAVRPCSALPKNRSACCGWISHAHIPARAKNSSKADSSWRMVASVTPCARRAKTNSASRCSW